MSQRNALQFLRTPLDEKVAALPMEERRQIMLDFDELERTGKNGDTRLRHHAGEIYRQLQGRPSGFDAAYMMFVGMSAHKITSMEAQEDTADLALDDQRYLAHRLLTRLVNEAGTLLADPVNALEDLIREARALLGNPAVEPDSGPSM